MEHWWDIDTVKPGTDCVDWTPLFDFYSRHSRPLNRIKKINFTTAAPGISSKNYWVTVEQQKKQFEFSNIEIEYVPIVNVLRTKTSNIKTLAVDTEQLGLKEGSDLSIIIDEQNLEGKVKGAKLYLTEINDKWIIAESLNTDQKHPDRYGSFKDLFRDNLVLVYGTNGSKKENELLIAKVRYDSEMFWYVGNGAFDIIADKDFDPAKYEKNNILLYGNKEQNSAYDKLLADSPVRISDNSISVKDNEIRGKDMGCYFVYPKKGSNNNLVGVIAGTGEEGIKLTYLRPFLKPGSSFPDFTVFNTEILKNENKGIDLSLIHI
jgi:hypothetical protein